MMLEYSSFSIRMTATLERRWMPGFGAAGVGEASGFGPRNATDERTGTGGEVTVFWDVVPAAEAGPMAAAGAARGAPELAVGRGPGLTMGSTNGDASGAVAVGDGVLTAFVNVGKGVPQATSSSVQQNIRRARTRRSKATEGSIGPRPWANLCK
jgi:hypothetical protein